VLPVGLQITPNQLPSNDGAGGTGSATNLPPTISHLELRIHKVKCVDETGLTNWGSDEIALAGTTIDESGDTRKVTEFKVQNFDRGDVKTYLPPKPFAVFDLRQGTAFPKAYFAAFILAEKDNGGLSDFANNLVTTLRAEVKAVLIGALTGSSGPLVNALIGPVVNWVVDKVFEWLQRVWNDDIFNPQTVSTEISSLRFSFSGRPISGQKVLTFSGHRGTYELNYDWRVFRQT
jgi:hypothetical protein